MLSNWMSCKGFPINISPQKLISVGKDKDGKPIRLAKRVFLRVSRFRSEKYELFLRRSCVLGGKMGVVGAKVMSNLSVKVI